MPPVGFEPTISAGERPQTHALDRAATGTGIKKIFKNLNLRISSNILFYFNHKHPTGATQVTETAAGSHS